MTMTTMTRTVDDHRHGVVDVNTEDGNYKKFADKNELAIVVAILLLAAICLVLAAECYGNASHHNSVT